MTDRELWSRYTDYVDSDQYLFCWGFLLQALEDNYGSYYGLPVKRALMQGLKALGDSRNKRLRDRRITIWMGDYGWHYRVGVPGKTSAQVTNILGMQFAKVAGYDTSEFGSNVEIGLIPAFRYESGQVIEYSDQSVVGTEKVDDDDWYGSGLTILHRMVEPAFLSGGEKYQG